MQPQQLLNWAAPRPAGTRASINITLEPATLVADGGGLQFTNGFYRCTWVGLGKQTRCVPQAGWVSSCACAGTHPRWQGWREWRHLCIWAHAAHQGGRAILDLPGQSDVHWPQLHPGKPGTAGGFACGPNSPSVLPCCCWLTAMWRAGRSGFAVVPGVNHLLFGPRAASSCIRTLQGAANSFRPDPHQPAHPRPA